MKTYNRLLSPKQITFTPLLATKSRQTSPQELSIQARKDLAFASHSGLDSQAEAFKVPQKLYSQTFGQDADQFRTLNLTTTRKHRYRNHRTVQGSSKTQTLGFRKPSAKNNNFLQSLGDPNATGASSSQVGRTTNTYNQIQNFLTNSNLKISTDQDQTQPSLAPYKSQIRPRSNTIAQSGQAWQREIGHGGSFKMKRRLSSSNSFNSRNQSPDTSNGDKSQLLATKHFLGAPANSKSRNHGARVLQHERKSEQTENLHCLVPPVSYQGHQKHFRQLRNSGKKVNDYLNSDVGLRSANSINTIHSIGIKSSQSRLRSARRLKVVNQLSREAPPDERPTETVDFGQSPVRLDSSLSPLNAAQTQNLTVQPLLNKARTMQKRTNRRAFMAQLQTLKDQPKENKVDSALGGDHKEKGKLIITKTKKKKAASKTPMSMNTRARQEEATQVAFKLLENAFVNQAGISGNLVDRITKTPEQAHKPKPQLASKSKTIKIKPRKAPQLKEEPKKGTPDFKANYSHGNGKVSINIQQISILYNGNSVQPQTNFNEEARHQREFNPQRHTCTRQHAKPQHRDRFKERLQNEFLAPQSRVRRIPSQNSSSRAGSAQSHSRSNSKLQKPQEKKKQKLLKFKRASLRQPKKLLETHLRDPKSSALNRTSSSPNNSPISGSNLGDLRKLYMRQSTIKTDHSHPKTVVTDQRNVQNQCSESTGQKDTTLLTPKQESPLKAQNTERQRMVEWQRQNTDESPLRQSKKHDSPVEQSQVSSSSFNSSSRNSQGPKITLGVLKESQASGKGKGEQRSSKKSQKKVPTLNSQSSKRRLTNESFDMDLLSQKKKPHEPAEEYGMNLNIPEMGKKTQSQVQQKNERYQGINASSCHSKVDKVIQDNSSINSAVHQHLPKIKIPIPLSDRKSESQRSSGSGRTPKGGIINLKQIRKSNTSRGSVLASPKRNLSEDMKPLQGRATEGGEIQNLNNSNRKSPEAKLLKLPHQRTSGFKPELSQCPGMVNQQDSESVSCSFLDSESLQTETESAESLENDQSSSPGVLSFSQQIKDMGEAGDNKIKFMIDQQFSLNTRRQESQEKHSQKKTQALCLNRMTQIDSVLSAVKFDFDSQVTLTQKRDSRSFRRATSRVFGASYPDDLRVEKHDLVARNNQKLIDGLVDFRKADQAKKLQKSVTSSMAFFRKSVISPNFSHKSLLELNLSQTEFQGVKQAQSGDLSEAQALQNAQLRYFDALETTYFEKLIKKIEDSQMFLKVRGFDLKYSTFLSDLNSYVRHVSSPTRSKRLQTPQASSPKKLARQWPIQHVNKFLGTVQMEVFDYSQVLLKAYHINFKFIKDPKFKSRVQRVMEAHPELIDDWLAGEARGNMVLSNLSIKVGAKLQRALIEKKSWKVISPKELGVIESDMVYSMRNKDMFSKINLYRQQRPIKQLQALHTQQTLFQWVNNVTYSEMVWRDKLNHKAFLVIKNPFRLDQQHSIKPVEIRDLEALTIGYGVFQQIDWTLIRTGEDFCLKKQKGQLFETKKMSQAADRILKFEIEQPLAELIGIPSICVNRILINSETKILRVAAISIFYIISRATPLSMQFLNDCVFYSRFENQVAQMRIHSQLKKESRLAKKSLGHCAKKRMTSSFFMYPAFQVVSRYEQFQDLLFKASIDSLFHNLYDREQDYELYYALQKLYRSAQLKINSVERQSAHPLDANQISEKLSSYVSDLFHSTVNRQHFSLPVQQKTRINQIKDQVEFFKQNKLEFKRQGALDNFQKETCKFHFVQMQDRSRTHTKDRFGIYYKEVLPMIWREDPDYGVLYPHFGYKCKFVRSSPFSNLVMEMFFPIELEKGNAKLDIKEELTKAPNNLIEIFANQLYSQINQKKSDKEFEQVLVSDFNSDESMAELSVDGESHEGSGDSPNNQLSPDKQGNALNFQSMNLKTQLEKEEVVEKKPSQVEAYSKFTKSLGKYCTALDHYKRLNVWNQANGPTNKSEILMMITGGLQRNQDTYTVVNEEDLEETNNTKSSGLIIKYLKGTFKIDVVIYETQMRVLRDNIAQLDKLEKLLMDISKRKDFIDEEEVKINDSIQQLQIYTSREHSPKTSPSKNDRNPPTRFQSVSYEPKDFNPNLIMDNVMKDIQRLKQCSKQKLLQETLDIKEMHKTIKNDLYAKETAVTQIYKVLKQNQKFLQGMKQFKKMTTANDSRASIWNTLTKKPGDQDSDKDSVKSQENKQSTGLDTGLMNHNVLQKAIVQKFFEITRSTNETSAGLDRIRHRIWEKFAQSKAQNIMGQLKAKKSKSFVMKSTQESLVPEKNLIMKKLGTHLGIVGQHLALKLKKKDNQSVINESKECSFSSREGGKNSPSDINTRRISCRSLNIVREENKLLLDLQEIQKSNETVTSSLKSSRSLSRDMSEDLDLVPDVGESPVIQGRGSTNPGKIRPFELKQISQQSSPMQLQSLKLLSSKSAAKANPEPPADEFENIAKNPIIRAIRMKMRNKNDIEKVGLKGEEGKTSLDQQKEANLSLLKKLLQIQNPGVQQTSVKNLIYRRKIVREGSESDLELENETKLLEEMKQRKKMRLSGAGSQQKKRLQAAKTQFFSDNFDLFN